MIFFQRKMEVSVRVSGGEGEAPEGGGGWCCRPGQEVKGERGCNRGCSLELLHKEQGRIQDFFQRLAEISTGIAEISQGWRGGQRHPPETDSEQTLDVLVV